MAKNDEQGAARHLKASLNDNLKSLHIAQQHLQQTGQALCSNSSFGRSQAMWLMTRQQTNLVQSANVMKQDAESLLRVKQAHTLQLQYDQTAAHKILRCVQLEQSAQQLDSVTSSRPYNRLHPRYALN